MPVKNRDNKNRLLKHRVISASEVRRRVVYTLPGISKLEKAGLFPRRIQISQKRIGWYLDEIVQWMQDRIDARQIESAYLKKIILTESDRFISKREASKYVLLSWQQIYAIETAGIFPGRIKLGPKRVAYLEREIVRWIEDRR